MKTTKLLLGLALVTSSLVGFAQPTPAVMKTGQQFRIQSAMNKGRDHGGFWDIPGSPKLIEKGSNIQVWDIDGGDDRYFTLVESPEQGYYEMYVGSTPASRIDVSGGKTKDGTNVGVWEKTNGNNQRFLFHHLGNGRFKIYDRNGKVLCLAGRSNKNGSNVHIWSDHDGPWTEWFLISRTGGGTVFIPTETQQVAEAKLKGTAVPESKNFYIQSAMSYDRNNDGFWDLPGTNGTAQDANIQIWTLDGGTDRYFRFEKRRDSEYYQIYAGKTSDGVVDLPGGKTDNGNVMQIWKVNNGGGQDFYLKHLGNGRFKIYHRSGKIINLKNTDNKNGNKVQLWSDHDGIHCEWYLIDPNTRKAYIPGNNAEVPVNRPSKPEMKSDVNEDVVDLKGLIEAKQTTAVTDHLGSVSMVKLRNEDNGDAIVSAMNGLSADGQANMCVAIMNGAKQNRTGDSQAVRKHVYTQLANADYKKQSFLIKALMNKHFSDFKESDPELKKIVSEIQSKMSNAK
ncbi:MAG: RICIN domain-containing protein [Bacteroidales bacterium]